MFSLLHDSEVTRLLLEFIVDTPGGRRSVGRLARTCKGLSGPALDVLWKDLDSLNPLLALMPGHLFKRARRPGMGFIKMPEGDDWEKFLSYGKRVRRITYNEAAGNVVSNILSTIEDSRPHDDILPNLTSLTWRAESPENLERSLLFFAPSLSNLTVETGSRIAQQDLESFLREVAGLNRLTALSISSASRLPDALSSFLVHQVALEKVSIMGPGSTSPSVGRWLASLPRLRTLQLDITGRSDTTISAFLAAGTSSVTRKRSRTPDSGVVCSDDESEVSEREDKSRRDVPTAFSRLERISLTGEPTTIVFFLNHAPIKLRYLDLTMDDPEEESEWRAVCTTIQRRLGSNLYGLSVSATSSSKFSDLVRSTARGDSSAKTLVLEDLKSLPHLRRLEIDLPETIVVRPIDMRCVADACPSLEHLKLSPLSRWPVTYGSPKITFTDIAPLTSKCRRLQSLHIPIYADKASDEDLLGSDSSSLSLRHLHLGHSWIDDPLQAAILLSHLAPNLHDLRWFHEKNRPGYIETNNLRWQKVSEILPAVQRVRIRERQRTIVKHVQVVNAAPPPPPIPRIMLDQAVDATIKIVKIDRDVQVKPFTSNFNVQVRPTVGRKLVQATPQTTSQEIDAVLRTKDQEVDAVPQSQTQEVDARPALVSQSVNTSDMIPIKMEVDDSTIIVRSKDNDASLAWIPVRAVYYTTDLFIRTMQLFSPATVTQFLHSLIHTNPSNQ